MKTKLWEKEVKTDPIIERFTIGNDAVTDLMLAPYDVQASLAHAKMLAKVGLLTSEEFIMLQTGLMEIRELLAKGEFNIEDGVEDIHSQIELHLTKKFGDVGKKIHTARSRNDQVLTAIKLFLKAELEEISRKCRKLQKELNQLSAKHMDVPLPGYTHMQVAMPSSFGLWFGAYADSIEDDLEMVRAAHRICDKNPLGSAAGYGTSFNIDKQFTTAELGFSALNQNPVYAQMTRGKSEKMTAIAIATVASTISKLSYDICLFLCQNFGFISFPENLTTGSSIMPHKKNPDVFELLRGRCNMLQDLPNQLTLLINNLPSGYHRDMQLTKEIIFPAVKQIRECLDVLVHVLPQIEINHDILSDEKYRYIHSVDEVNRLVMAGVPFREAYNQVADRIREGTFVSNGLSENSIV
jgi:argininosuccinate lyase